MCRQEPKNSDTLPLTGKSARMEVIQTVGRLKLSESQHSENRPCQEHQQWLVWQKLRLMYGRGTVGPEAEAQGTQSGCGLTGRLGKPAREYAHTRSSRSGPGPSETPGAWVGK